MNQMVACVVLIRAVPGDVPALARRIAGIDGVAEVSVVAAPDERFGERAAAVIRTREGAEIPSLDTVRAHLAEAGLARQKWPESLHHVAELPRTPSGKVQKFLLRRQLRDGAL